MQALVQAGILGTVLFLGAVGFAWLKLIRLLRNLSSLPNNHKYLVIQCGGVLAFLSVRSFPESTGAFFGIDWLILALVLSYLQVVKYDKQSINE
jgi:O-antigen ligase